MDKADTLIPLKWFYEQLTKCKARQKVLVLDVNRYNQTFGQERPGGDEMGPKLDAMLKCRRQECRCGLPAAPSSGPTPRTNLRWAFFWRAGMIC